MHDEEGVWTRQVGVGWQQGKREMEQVGNIQGQSMGAQVFTIRDGSRNYRQRETRIKLLELEVMT